MHSLVAGGENDFFTLIFRLSLSYTLLWIFTDRPHRKVCVQEICVKNITSVGAPVGLSWLNAQLLISVKVMISLS